MPQHDESKPAGVAFWADGPTAADTANDRYETGSWPPQPTANDRYQAGSWAPPPPATTPAAAPPAADRHRGGRHARRNPGHGGAGHHTRASLAARTFG